MNKHNSCIWGTENPENLMEVPQRSKKVMVRCAMPKTKLIGPYFFRQSSVDAAAYKSMLRYYELHHIEQLQVAPIFQQYGASAHTSRLVTEYLQRKLEDRWISKRGPINWPPRSPGLTPLDFFSLGLRQRRNRIY